MTIKPLLAPLFFYKKVSSQTGKLHAYVNSNGGLGLSTSIDRGSIYDVLEVIDSNALLPYIMRFTSKNY